MEKKTLIVGKTPHIKIIDIAGDLRITGHDKEEIQAKTSGDALELSVENEEITLTCDDNLILTLPQNAQIEIISIAGDASFRNLANTLNLANIGGDLVLRDMGVTEIGQIGNDLVVRRAVSLKIDSIGDDASIRDITGDVTITNIGNDLHLRGVRGNLEATVGDDAVLYIQPQKDANYTLTAGAEILLRLPENADVGLDLTAGDDLSINLPGIEASDEKRRKLDLGLATATLTFSAGKDFHVTLKADAWANMADFDSNTPFRGIDITSFGNNFAENITKHFDSFPDKFFEKLSHKMDTFPDGKMRRAERKSARHKIRFVGKKPLSPVSDDERLLILKMLEEKKISAADAGKLLSALEA